MGNKAGRDNHRGPHPQLSTLAESVGKMGDRGDEGPSEMVRLSQLPTINLMVDLNDAGCRRRRRRQLSSLMSISEEADANPDQEDAISSFSPNEPAQSNSAVLQEIRATMAIGSQLGIIFRPNDDVILGKMIEIEAQEYSALLEKDARG
ncbi:hypothetical protein RHMOL_Rhmol09G0036400 [Rhododendron molle]|uniref:Uncharacterized protein n=1 Tax=Rhododendron molle TaxID=49168 RepID=A0ACC0MB96_RHOML|nr:hypothetical protein RHMOL_Rhmol09G0036400 [Rhododendron molle]